MNVTTLLRMMPRMPIKFRCNYCRQFLGISRSRAGGVVDCPTCGRSIRVPELDGSLAPVPEPAMDGGDSHLARALDELAALARLDAPLKPVAADLAEPDDEIPQPIPEPVPVEIPMPVAVKPLAPPLSGAAGAAVDVANVAVAEVIQELASAVAPTAEAPRAVVTVAPTAAVPTRVLLLAAFAPLLTLVIGVGLGWILGRQFGSTMPTSAPDAAAVAVEQRTTAAAVEGRISYQSDEGDVRPDIGACVIALPATWDAASRLSPIGLRPADSPIDQQVAVAFVTGMQGALAWADAEGRFQISLPAAGSYRLLILSRLASRVDDAPLPAEIVQQLQVHLQDPSATIGRRAYVVRDVEAKAGVPSVWDHQFVR